MKLEWTTKKVKVKDLKNLDINPRKISDEKKEKLKKSIEKFNLVEIPAVDFDYTIIGGNQRVKVLIMLGKSESDIDVRYPNRKLTNQELKEYSLISNTHAGEFDFDILDMEFTDINIDDFDFDLDGFTEWKIKNNSKQVDNIEDDDFTVPEGGIETDILEGDLIQIGSHKLLCGSSTNIENWSKLMNDEFADLVITDPPYNVDYVGKTKEKLKIENDSMSNDQFYTFLFDFYSALGHFTKPGGAWYVWHADSEGANFRKAMSDAGIMVKQCLVWVKNSMVMGRQDYHWQHEPCLYGWKPGAAHNWYSDRKQTTILNFDRPSKNIEHPTMKPVPLISYQILNSSAKNDIVCDGFGGSGTTMVAAHKLNRICRMMELDPKYCQVIVNRMIALDPEIKVYKNQVLWNTTKNS